MAKHYSGLFSLVFLCSQIASSAPLDRNASTATSCQNPRIRKEWRSLTIDERKDYIRAVKCMYSSPPKTKMYVGPVQTRYDDFVAMHINTTLGGLDMNKYKGPESVLDSPLGPSFVMENHAPDQILPWHRFAIQLWEDALRDECGLKGSQPYWDYHLDSAEAGGNFLKSPIFDPVAGFGGNGAKLNYFAFLNPILQAFNIPPLESSGGGCLVDGPFKDVKLNIGPLGRMDGTTPRCLTRDLNPMAVNLGAIKKNYARVLASKTFLEFGLWIEAPDVHFGMASGNFNVSFDQDFHSIGHGSIGGEMMDALNSVNDPLFWMHHTSMDRLWALWQEQDAQRLEAPNIKLWVGPMSKDRTGAELFDTQNRSGKGALCYKYEGLDAKYYMS